MLLDGCQSGHSPSNAQSAFRGPAYAKLSTDYRLTKQEPRVWLLFQPTLDQCLLVLVDWGRAWRRRGGGGRGRDRGERGYGDNKRRRRGGVRRGNNNLLAIHTLLFLHKSTMNISRIHLAYCRFVVNAFCFIISVFFSFGVLALLWCYDTYISSFIAKKNYYNILGRFIQVIYVLTFKSYLRYLLN